MSAAPAPPPARPAASPPPAAARPAPGATPAPPPAEPWTERVVDEGSVLHDRLRVLEWTVRGASKVVGPAVLGLARIQGIATLASTLEASDLSAEGTLNVTGASRVEHGLRVQGSARFEASVQAGSFEVKGRLELAGDLRVTGPVTLQGHAELSSGGLSATALDWKGRLLVPGEVRVTGPVRATLEGRSSLGNLFAESVELKAPRFPPWRAPGTLAVRRIEGNELRLEGVVAEYVRSPAIYVGPGCRIARYEGTVKYRARDAVLGPSVRSDVPPGYTR